MLVGLREVVEYACIWRLLRHGKSMFMITGRHHLVIDSHTGIGQADEGKKTPPLVIALQAELTRPYQEMTKDFDFVIGNG